jgi:hypothetical protein
LAKATRHLAESGLKRTEGTIHGVNRDRDEAPFSAVEAIVIAGDCESGVLRGLVVRSSSREWWQHEEFATTLMGGRSTVHFWPTDFGARPGQFQGLRGQWYSV